MTENNELYHYGVPGMRWGVRKASKQYYTLANKAKKNLNNSYYTRYVNAYNKTADEYNNGKIEAFNKTHNVKSSKYLEQYSDAFDKDLAKNFSKMLYDDIHKDKNYIKAQQICKKYNLESVDKFAKDNEQSVKDLRKLIGEWDND